MKDFIKSSRNRLYNFARQSTDEHLIKELHLEVVAKVKKLLLDTKINNSATISDIAFIKTYSYHTNIDRAARQILCLSKMLKRNLIISENKANSISSFLINRNIQKLTTSLLSKKMEDDVILPNNANCKELPDKKVDIIFIASMSSYLGMIINIAPSFKMKYAIFTTKKAASGIEKNLLDKNVFIIEEYFSQELIELFYKTQKDSCSYYYDNIIRIEESLNFIDVNFFQIYEDVLLNIWKYVIPQSELYYILMNNFLERFRPDHVIGVRVRRLFERAAFVAARKKNINTSIVLHSTFGSVIDDYYLTGHFDLIDDAFVWGENHRKMIESDILSSKCNVHIVGSTQFTKQKILNYKKVKDGSFKILYAATSKGELKEIRKLLKIAKKIGGIKVIIKAHPNIENNIYERFSKLSFVKIITERKPIETMMSNINLLVTTYSGSHVYAALCGIPIALLAFNSFVENDLREIYGLSYLKNSFVIKDDKSFYKLVYDIKQDCNDEIKKIMDNQNNYINNFISVRESENDVISDISNRLNFKKL